MNKKLKVIQSNYKSCASACLLSIIRYYGGNISQEELSDLINTSSKGTTAYFMIEGAKKIGLDGYGEKLSTNEIFQKDIILPCIAHVKSNNYYHFVVIYEVNTKRNKIKVMDPAYGFVSLSKEEFDKIYLNTALFFYKVRNLINEVDDYNLKSILKKYILVDKRKVIVLFALSLIIVVLSIISSLFLKVLVDYVIEKSLYNMLYYCSIPFILMIILNCYLSYVRNKTLIKYKYSISKNMTMDIIKHILYLPSSYYKNKSTGEIMSRISDTSSVNDLITSVVLKLGIDVIIILFSMFTLIIINFKMFLIILVFLTIYIIISIIFYKINNNKIYEYMSNYSSYNGYLNESINNYLSIKNLNITSKILRKLEMKYNNYLSKSKEFEERLNISSQIKNSTCDIGVLLSLVVGSYFVIKSDLTVGSLVAFNTLALYFTSPIKNIFDIFPEYTFALNSLHRMKDFMMIREDHLNNLNSKKINGDIIIKKLSYAYNGIDYVFKNMNLEIKKGSKLLIFGSSGGGKSTFIKLLLKYYDAYEGNVYIGNKNLKDIKSEVCNNSYNYVSQDEFLFNDTLKNNIVCYRNIKEDMYEKILKICKVDEIRNSKIFRDEYLIEESGFNLSGGEKQKIILARALLKDANYIILDEALSEVSIEDEKEIINNINNYFKNKTLIYISHNEEIKSVFKNIYRFRKEEYA